MITYVVAAIFAYVLLAGDDSSKKPTPIQQCSQLCDTGTVQSYRDCKCKDIPDWNR